ncbi:hypothetical protein BDW74DRAFT_172297 [Aspergillus multicolor]|uniref:NAD(P)/FAD-dependent oxidoreductase n=1 Tax=Aspergillus multicolor TaxID=41759 RepID=UPI003CCCD2FB
MSTSPSGIYEKGIIDPGVPVSNPTSPFWLSSPSKISTLQSPWLSTADIIIIGSGMTAASLSRTLLNNPRHADAKIILLEARTLCSGATGRNGGHIKAQSPGFWHERKESYGVEEAVKIMEFEHRHLGEMVKVIKELGLECDLQEIEGLDVYHDAKVFAHAVSAVKEMRNVSPTLGARYTIYTDKAELAKRQVGGPNIVGAIGMKAASMWPYKMVTGILERLVKQHKGRFSIQTNTTVKAITNNKSDEYTTVHTSRGDIKAKIVVHATNAWVGHLIPELRPYISPVRANVQRRRAQAANNANDTSKEKIETSFSWWLRYGEHDYDYLIHRPDNSFILGRSNTGRRATANDSEVDFLPHAHLKGVTPQVFDFKDAGFEKGEVTHAWSGPVAFTHDGNQFVGRVPFPGYQRQWVAAGFQGIGMVRAFLSAEMLARLIGGEELEERYPRSLIAEEKRFGRLQGTGGGSAERSKL